MNGIESIFLHPALEPGGHRIALLEHVPKKLTGFFDQNMLQVFESEKTGCCGDNVPKSISVPETMMTKLNGFRASAWLMGVALIAGITFMAGAGLDTAHAADLGYMPAPQMAPPLYGYFNPFTDPRCRIIPVPEASLYGFGETARFRPTAVCQSRGLYTDSVVLP